MVLDQAGRYDPRALSMPATVTLVSLPSYSPDTCKVWRRLTAEVGRIKSLCTYPWIPKVKI
jgi:hypothetical protein